MGNLTEDNHVEILTNGEEKFECLLTDIQNAKKEVLIQYYIFKEDFLFGKEAPVQIGVGDRHIVFECGGYKLLSRLLEGDFINYGAAIPAAGKTRVRLNVRQMADSISRASIIINEKIKSPIRALFSDGSVQISCETPLGSIVDSVPAEITGDGLLIGFNNRLMLDALKACSSDEVIMEMSSPHAPIKILPLEGEHFTFLVMPMRFRE